MSCAIVRLNSKAAMVNFRLIMLCMYSPPLMSNKTGFYPCVKVSINAQIATHFAFIPAIIARVKAFKLSAEFCHLRRRYARQARCRLYDFSSGRKRQSARATSGNISGVSSPRRYAAVGYQARDIDFASELKGDGAWTEETGGVALC